MVKFELKGTEDPTHLYIQLNNTYPELQRIIINITTISINGLNSSDFNYSLQNASQYDPLRYDLLLEYFVPIISSPVIRVSMDIPITLGYDPKYGLTSQQIFATAPSYFAMKPSTAEDIPRAKGGSKAGGYLLSITTLILSLLESSNVLGIFALLNVDMINNFR